MNTAIPYYEIVNRFLLGLVFVAVIVIFHIHEIMNLLSTEAVQTLINPIGVETITTVCSFAIIYEIGYIINRISSVATEEILIFIRFWPCRSNYVSYNKAKKHYDILSVLSREYNICRGQITLFFILMSYFATQCCLSYVLFCCSFIIIFVLSGRKCSEHINKLVKDFEGSSFPQIITKG